VSETIAPTSTLTSAAPNMTTTATYAVNASVTTDVETDYTTYCPVSASATISYPGSNSTAQILATPTTTPATVPTISTVPVAGAGFIAPSVVSTFLAAAALAAALL
jgi:hypothetical protein